MPTLYDPNGTAVSCRKDQVKDLIASGFTEQVLAKSKTAPAKPVKKAG